MSSAKAWCVCPVSESELPAISALAREIWYQHYPGIITVAQIDYMLDQRYRPSVIRSQLAAGRAWWIKLHVAEALAGFAAYEPGARAGSIKLDKLYVHPRHRGMGCGSALIRHVEQAARAQGCSEIYLQVNKHNTGAINAYLRNGFAIGRAVKVDIGGGFFMDDYVMEKKVRA